MKKNLNSTLARPFQFSGGSPKSISLACCALAIFLALGSCWFGVSQRFNHWMPEAIEYENVKVAAAISDLVYGIKDGYVAHTQVYDALREGGFTIESRFLEPLGTRFPDNLSDVELLNRGLKRAAEIENLRTSKRIIHDFKPVEVNDLGQVIFYRWAFKLFGLEIQSFYKLYYALFFSAIALFIFAYWRRVEAAWAMLIVVGAHLFAQGFLAGGLTPQETWAVATPYSQRFVSVLGILSALHIALAALWRPRFNFVNVAAVVGQTIILFFVYTMRRSAMWEVLWGGLIATGFLILILLWRWNGRKKWLVSYVPAHFVRRVSCWPAAIFVAIFVLASSVYNASIHSVFRFSDEFMPQHMFWHSTYLGLSIHPKWQERFGDQYKNEKGDVQMGDSLPITAAQVWLRDKYGIEPSYIISPIWGYKYRTTERVIREMYFDFIKQNKKFVLALHLVHKPLAFFKSYVRWNIRTLKSWPLWGRGILVGIVVMCMAMAAFLGYAGYSSAMKQLAGITFVGSGLAVVPAILVFPSYQTMSDQAMMLNIAVLVFVGTGMSMVAWKYKLVSENRI